MFFQAGPRGGSLGATSVIAAHHRAWPRAAVLECAASALSAAAPLALTMGGQAKKIFQSEFQIFSQVKQPLAGFELGPQRSKPAGQTA